MTPLTESRVELIKKIIISNDFKSIADVSKEFSKITGLSRTTFYKYYTLYNKRYVNQNYNSIYVNQVIINKYKQKIINFIKSLNKDCFRNIDLCNAINVEMSSSNKLYLEVMRLLDYFENIGLIVKDKLKGLGYYSIIKNNLNKVKKLEDAYKIKKERMFYGKYFRN